MTTRIRVFANYKGTLCMTRKQRDDRGILPHDSLTIERTLLDGGFERIDAKVGTMPQERVEYANASNKAVLVVEQGGVYEISMHDIPCLRKVPLQETPARVERCHISSSL